MGRFGVWRNELSRLGRVSVHPKGLWPAEQSAYSDRGFKLVVLGHNLGVGSIKRYMRLWQAVETARSS